MRGTTLLESRSLIPQAADCQLAVPEEHGAVVSPLLQTKLGKYNTGLASGLARIGRRRADMKYSDSARDAVRSALKRGCLS